jgi:hypothetical protein
MGAVSDQLFRDDDLRDMYCPDNGQPSLPPSLMSGVLLLQFYAAVSDGEAVERTHYDLRWKVALWRDSGAGDWRWRLRQWR